MTNVIKYQMSDILGGNLRIIVQPFWKIVADRLFFIVFVIKSNFWDLISFKEFKLAELGLTEIFYLFSLDKFWQINS